MGRKDRRTPGQAKASENRGRRKDDKRTRERLRADSLGLTVDRMKQLDAINNSGLRATPVHVPADYGTPMHRERTSAPA